MLITVFVYTHCVYTRTPLTSNEVIRFHFPNFVTWKFELKGHWTTSASSPDFFQKSWDFYTIRSVYLCSDCMLNLTCNPNSVTKIFEFFFQQPFLKVNFLKWLPLSWLLNLAPSTIILAWRKILKLVCAVFWTDTNIKWTLCKLWYFGLEYIMF